MRTLNKRMDCKEDATTTRLQEETAAEQAELPQLKRWRHLVSLSSAEQQTAEDNSHGMRLHISNPEMQRRQQRSATVFNTGLRTTGQSNWMIGCAVVMTTSTKRKLRRLSITTASQERCPWQDRSNVKKNTAVGFCSVNDRVPFNWNGREDDLMKKKQRKESWQE